MLKAMRALSGLRGGRGRPLGLLPSPRLILQLAKPAGAHAASEPARLGA